MNCIFCNKALGAKMQQLVTLVAEDFHYSMFFF